MSIIGKVFRQSVKQTTVVEFDPQLWADLKANCRSVYSTEESKALMLAQRNEFTPESKIVLRSLMTRFSHLLPRKLSSYAIKVS